MQVTCKRLVPYIFISTTESVYFLQCYSSLHLFWCASSYYFTQDYCSQARCTLCGIYTSCTGSPFPIVYRPCQMVFYFSIFLNEFAWIRNCFKPTFFAYNKCIARTAALLVTNAPDTRLYIASIM